MTTITLATAEKELGQLLKRAREGEEIVILDGDGPGIMLSPVSNAAPGRGFGLLKGKISASDEDLFGPLPEDELKRWWGEEK